LVHVLIPTIEPRSFLISLKRPASLLPVVFFAVAVIGMLWADGPWADRFHGLNPVAKLLAIPFLLYHFQRPKRGSWVFLSFPGFMRAVTGAVLDLVLHSAVADRRLARFL